MFPVTLPTLVFFTSTLIFMDLSDLNFLTEMFQGRIRLVGLIFQHDCGFVTYFLLWLNSLDTAVFHSHKYFTSSLRSDYKVVDSH